MKKTTAQALQGVATDLLAIKFKATDSYNTNIKKFYTVMRKHGIKEGHWSQDGVARIVSSPEWSMCYEFFKSLMEGHNIFLRLMQVPPADLLAYGKKPKRVTAKTPIN